MTRLVKVEAEKMAGNAGATWFTHATLIDGTGADPVEDQALLVEGGRIVDVGATADIARRAVESGATEIDVTGKVIMPGMVDCHFHGTYEKAACFEDYDLRTPVEESTLFHAKNSQAMLRSGFTSVREVGARGLVSVSVARAIRSGMLVGPRIVPGGRILTSTGGLADAYGSWVRNDSSLGHVVDGELEVRKAVRDQIKYGTQTIKVEANGAGISPFAGGRKSTMSEDEMRAAVYEASRNGARVASHARSVEGILASVRAGVTTIEHGTFLDDECASAMLQRGTVLVPTLSVLYLYATKGRELGVSQAIVDRSRADIRSHEESFRFAVEAGIPLAVGSDSGHVFNPQGTAAVELEMMVKYGCTPSEAIRAATSNGARAIGFGSSVGTLARGFLADFLVLDRNPVEDIAVLQELSSMAGVYQGGRLRGGYWLDREVASRGRIAMPHPHDSAELELPYEEVACC